MKKVIVLLMIMTVGYSVQAQDPILQFDNDKLEEIAYDVTKAYNKQLGLDGKQVILFQKKVEEFLIREEKIHQRYSGEEKLSLIAELRKAETMEMRNILTQPQMTVYEKWKPTIQPLAIIEDDKN